MYITMDGVGSKAVSKRSGRMYVEDGTGVETPEHQAKMMSKYEEAAPGEARRKNSTPSASQSPPSSRQTSHEISPLIPSIGLDHEMENLAIDSAGSGGYAAYSATYDLEETTNVVDKTHPMNKTSRTIHTGLQLHALIPVPGPALNFGKVTEGVYRSSYPQLEDHAFMESLGLKTIVTLVQKDFPEGYGAFISTHGIKHHVFDMRGTKKEEIPQETMESILELVQNEQNHPLLIHCNHGRHRTGCVAAIVRKHCNHNLDEIIKEYESFAGTKSRECDIKYITAYDTSISKKSFEILPRIQERNFRHIVLSVILLVIVLCTKRLLVS